MSLISVFSRTLPYWSIIRDFLWHRKIWDNLPWWHPRWLPVKLAIKDRLRKKRKWRVRTILQIVKVSQNLQKYFIDGFLLIRIFAHRYEALKYSPHMSTTGAVIAAACHSIVKIFVVYCFVTMLLIDHRELARMGYLVINLGYFILFLHKDAFLISTH